MKNNLKLTELCKREMSRIIGGDAPCKCACTCVCSGSEIEAGALLTTGCSASGSGRNHPPDPVKA